MVKIILAALMLVCAGCATRHQTAEEWCRSHGIEVRRDTPEGQLEMDAYIQWLEQDL